MNIVYDNIIFSLQRSGGISVVWAELLKRAINDKKLSLKFIEYDNSNLFRRELNIDNHLLINNSILPLNIKRYMNVKKHNDNVIFHSSYYRIMNGNNVSNITTVHDFTYEYYREGIAKKIHMLQKSNAIYNSDRIICVSENTKNDLFKFYPDINREIVSVVYNGVDSQYFFIDHNTDIELNKLIPFSAQKYLLYVGDRKSLYKNFYFAIDICNSINMPLVFVGGGVLTSKEKMLLDNKLGAKSYYHLSLIDNCKLNLLYNNALCLIYLSSYEGFGIPVVEAQSAGCPVVALNKSSIPEVIGDVDTIFNELNLNDVCHVISKLKNDSNFRADQCVKGLKNSKRFSWDKTYDGIKQNYIQILKRHL